MIDNNYYDRWCLEVVIVGLLVCDVCGWCHGEWLIDSDILILVNSNSVYMSSAIIIKFD